ncbi:metal-binding protein [Pseudomonas faucium]|uniref:metal-binding protein n=1 Tax=Pseudomonas faucium TaxID=2740518 RepID=UPI00283AA33C|nr:metal-binding protein [Pseudomonas faucium]
MTAPRLWRLLGSDGKPLLSTQPGTLGGHRAGKRYGRLDCRAALQAIARGGYVRHRVFFLDEACAIAAGYRPCAVCMPEAYRQWQRAHAGGGVNPPPAMP